MSATRGGTALALALAASLIAPGSAEAQRRPAGYVNIGILGADPVGELADYVDAGGGLQFEGLIPVEGSNRFRFRADLGFIIYGHERQRVCFNAPVGCRIQMDLNTTNSIFFGGIGPELLLATGAFQPYVNAMVGFSYFATTSALEGTWDSQDFATTNNFDDIVLARRVGGGVRWRVSRGRHPVSLDFGVEHHENGVAEFLTKGDIEDHPDGSITIYPNRAEANLVTMRFGVSVGIPSRASRGRGRR
jgi:hypothetical protein